MLHLSVRNAAGYRNGRYTLSSRAVMELQPYLKSTYEEEVLECTSCLEIVTKVWAPFTPYPARMALHTDNPTSPAVINAGHIMLHTELQVPAAQALLQIAAEPKSDVPCVLGGLVAQCARGEEGRGGSCGAG